ncbi:sensor histidine kinase [Mucilaginibacter sp. Mucisp86]|uniref:sensor histidine kinase n=1 Tax=Mucilaginibacter sp. Mucisp86 TaxID=3243060 RepID=UPI0039B5D1E7
MPVAIILTFGGYILAQNFVDFFIAWLTTQHYEFIFSYKKSLYRGVYLLTPAVGYFLTKEGIKKARAAKSIEIQNLQLETAYLRSKIKPHLIFNTLNYIYGLVEEASEEVTNIRLRKALKSTKLFSKVLRYALNNETEKVSLAQELEHVYHYIGLNRERLGKQLCFELALDVDSRVDDLQIPPLILITFVENIFMHGDLYNPEQPCRLSINCKGQQLSFHTWNLKKSAVKLERTGVGMAYIRNQLSRQYAGRYTLSINETDNYYELLFTIEL